jgi:hypothetical protein
MIFFACFSIATVLMAVLILKFDKRQAMKVNNMLKETSNVPPLFMIKATEQKVSALKAVLNYDDALKNMAFATAGSSDLDDHERISKVMDLKQLLTKYNERQISLEVYNSELDKLIDLV